MTKFHPILFKPFLAQANVEGHKTETRRLSLRNPKQTARLKEINQNPNDWALNAVDLSNMETGTFMFEFIHKPTGKFKTVDTGIAIGDIIWQRESIHNLTNGGEHWQYIYRADEHVADSEIKWKPAIHMPKAACRFWGEVTGIRFQRLQEITAEGVQAEGLDISDLGPRPEAHKDPFFNFGLETRQRTWDKQCIHRYLSLWADINGEDSVAKNPWVLVIQYKSVVKPANWTNP